MKTSAEFIIPVIRIMHFLFSLWTIADMVSDTLTTIQYYDYGINPDSFKCNKSKPADYLEKDNRTFTEGPPVESTDFSYFNKACFVWALNPSQQMIMNILWLFNDQTIGDGVIYDRIEDKLKCSGLTRKAFRERNCYYKMTFVFCTLPINLVISIIRVYLIDPMILILVALGNLHARIGDSFLIRKYNTFSTVIKYREATAESIGQCIIAMTFYSANKDYFSCPDTFFSWFNKGTIVICSMFFSIGSIILTACNRINETNARNYGKDWWKVMLCKRRNMLKKEPPEPLALLIAGPIMISSISIPFLVYLSQILN